MNTHHREHIDSGNQRPHIDPRREHIDSGNQRPHIDPRREHIDPRNHRPHINPRNHGPRLNHRMHRHPRYYRDYSNYGIYINYQNRYNNKWNIDNYNNESLNATREQTDNLMQSTIDSSIINAWTKSDLMVQQRWIESHSETTRKSIDYKKLDRWEAFKQWWLSWWLDKLLSNCNNLTPWQKDTWKSLWVLTCFAWWIYWLYKFYTNKKRSFLKKVWITAISIFSTQVLLWENPVSLFTKLMTWWLSRSEIKKRFGNCISLLGNSESEAAETTVPAMYSMILFNSSTKKSDIDRMTKAFKADNENRKTFYNQSCQKIKNECWEATMKTFQSIFSDQFWWRKMGKLACINLNHMRNGK